jgi:excisionase family DNA binding protein
MFHHLILNAMDVIVIESKAFQQIINQIAEIKDILTFGYSSALISQNYFSTEDLCRMLKISSRTMQRYRDKGLISFTQIGSKIFIKASDLDAFMEKYKIKAFRK